MAILKRKRKKKEALDKLDLDIIVEMQRDSSRTVKQLKALLRKPDTTIHMRIEKLVQQKIIKKNIAIVDFKKIGLAVSVMILMKLAPRKMPKEVADRLKRMHQVAAISVMSGDYQVMAKAYFKNNEALERFLYDQRTGLRSWDSIVDIKTIIIFSEEDKPVLLNPAEINKIESSETEMQTNIDLEQK